MTCEGIYDLIIVGGGPGGLTAGIYAMRAALKAVLVEMGAPGGQVNLSDSVENWPGEEHIGGAELSMKMYSHAQSYGLEIRSDEVVAIEPGLDLHTVRLAGGACLQGHAVILATGGNPRQLEIPGEKENYGKGVSYCGTCDAPFYRNMHVAVIGGGNTAIQEAEYLTKFASRVTVIHRREQLRATRIIQETAFANSRIDFIWNSRVTSIAGTTGVERLNLVDNSGRTSTLDVEGVFVLIGVTPNNACLPLDLLQADKWGFIPTDVETCTAVAGVMAAGDIRSKAVRQIVNAAGEGATAVLAAEAYLQSLKR